MTTPRWWCDGRRFCGVAAPRYSAKLEWGWGICTARLRRNSVANIFPLARYMGHEYYLRRRRRRCLCTPNLGWKLITVRGEEGGNVNFHFIYFFMLYGHLLML